MADGFVLTLRTPHEVVFEEEVDGARVSTETGQAGLRPHGEPLVSVVEPGLLLLRRKGEVRFAASAGGLLEFDGRQGTLYTPFAAVGEPSEVLAALERLQSTPDSELAARRHLGELEQRIVRELTTRKHVPEAGGRDVEA